MHAICPECKKLQPVGENDQMLDHPDLYEPYPCRGVGQESGIVVLGEKTKSKSRDSRFDRKMKDDGDHSTDSVDLSEEAPHSSLTEPFHLWQSENLNQSKPSIFGSIGDQIQVGLKKLSQKERKAKK